MKIKIDNKYYFYLFLTTSLIGTGIFYFKTFGLNGVFLTLPYILFLLILGGIIIIKALRQLRTKKPSSLIYIVVTCSMIVLLFTGQITRFFETLDWHLNYKLRTEIVNKIMSGELASNNENSQSVFKLPDSYRQVSNGGNEIMLYRNGDKISIKFYTDRGFLDYYNAFYYTNDSSEITRIEKRCKTHKANRKIDDNWYRISY